MGYCCQMDLEILLLPTFTIILKKLVSDTSIPIFGICLGHQLLGLALGAKTEKMNHGHHGANHPVLDLRTGKVEITSMNHGFAINSESLPPNILESHVSLFDGSNCGIEHKDKNIFFCPISLRQVQAPMTVYLLVNSLKW